MANDTALFKKVGISRGGTYFSLGVVISILIGALGVASWVNGMDEARGKELVELDKRLTRVEAHNLSMASSLERIESAINDIHRHLLEKN